MCLCPHPSFTQIMNTLYSHSHYKKRNYMPEALIINPKQKNQKLRFRKYKTDSKWFRTAEKTELNPHSKVYNKGCNLWRRNVATYYGNRMK